MPIRLDGDNATATPGITGGDADTGLVFGTDEVSIVTGGTQHVNVNANGDVDLGGLTVSGSAADDSVNIDSSGRLLVGTSTPRSNIFSGNSGPLTPQNQIETQLGNYSGGLSLINNSASGFSPVLTFGQSYTNTLGGNGLTPNGEPLGVINFTANDGTNFRTGAAIEARTDATTGSSDVPARLVFYTAADGAGGPTERMRLNSAGRLYCPGVYNFYSAVGANVYVDSSGNLIRATSSGKYKTDVETIEYDYSSALLNCRPVWFRSTSKNDNPNWGYWGFIAEEVAEIDPRLVHWKTIEVSYDENGSAVETPCEPEPEGVQYDRFVPHLLNLIKRQKEQIETQGAAIAALEAKVAALEANP